ncbi:hypothetical protein C5O75_007805 [Burkholderia cepacia]|uniref:hypothetical protein n=1 Tax=Burkholderia cepacia TaxID=292 RepID=UPI000CF196B1|nr:hypothetical protein [Burkholderia cepacia]KAB1593828.1 hypothetical protein C5O75_007805 [Burkholderia cepacia]
MDGLEFTSKIVEAVAWPGTVLVLAYKFSDRFRDLLGKLTEVTLPGGISGKFETPLKNAEHLAEQLQLDFSGDDGIEFTPDPIALDANPTGVVMEAWKELNSVAGDYLAMADVSRGDRVTAAAERDFIRLIEREKLIPPDEITLLRELREIRNRAAHSTTDRPTRDEAERFVTLVRALENLWVGRMASAEPR